MPIFCILISLLFIDQLTKSIILKNFLPGDSLPVIKNIFHITFVCNKGAAFGIFSEQGSAFIWISYIAVTIIVFIFIFFRKIFQERKTTQISFSLILAGAIGNLIDRLRFGFVIDFIDLRIWPVFNVADTAISIGTIMLVYSILKKPATS